MVALKDLSKQELKQLVLGELHAFGKETKRSKGASASASAASNTWSFYYPFTVLGTPVCLEVFSEVMAWIVTPCFEDLAGDCGEAGANWSQPSTVLG